MDEIRFLSAVVNMAATVFKLATAIIDSRKKEKPSPPQSEKVSGLPGE